MSALVQGVLVLVRCLVTVMLGREFHAPGTEISVSAGDAARLVQIGAAVVVDESDEEMEPNDGVIAGPLDPVGDGEGEGEQGEEDEQGERSDSVAGETETQPDPAAGESTPAAATGTRRGRRR